MSELNPLEQKVIDTIANGYEYNTAAEILKVRPSTVKRYMLFIREKLGAKNNAHAVYLVYHRD